MNREIKFRGRLKPNTNIWAYGHFTTDQHGNYYIVQLNGNPKDKTYPFYGVASDTISQFTGLKDFNGDEIYEGDRLRHHFDVDKIVVYDNKSASFQLEFEIGGGFIDSIEYFIERKGVVIGNIYENPELL